MYNSKKGRHYRRTKETAMHSPRVAPCVPLCGLLQEGGGICIPLRVLFGLLGECGRSPKSIGKLWIRADCGGELQGRKVCRLKGGWLSKAPSPD